jgi:hypothetical protein
MDELEQLPTWDGRAPLNAINLTHEVGDLP